jgi:thiamine phosphate synthase YjbQ (UPF0047 family)
VVLAVGRAVHNGGANLACGRSHEGLLTSVNTPSASLLIQEIAAPEVCTDLQAWFERAVPEGSSLYAHDDEGLDDMPAHNPMTHFLWP